MKWRAVEPGQDVILKPRDITVTIQRLEAAVKPGGRLPVKVSDKYPIGSGLSF